MKQSILKCIAVFLVLCVWPSVYAGEPPAAGLEAGLAPREELWHLLPANVTGAFVGRDGQCFYSQRGLAARTPSVSPAGIVAPGFRPVLLDRTGRLWCTGRGAETICGIKGDSIITLEPPKGASFETIDPVNGPNEERTAAYEDAAGRVWFGNSRGVQWFDGRVWSSKELADRRGVELGHPMTALHFAEDRQGRLYLWARPAPDAACGTEGFWLWDGKTWTQYTVRDGLPDDALQAVWPLGGDLVLLNTVRGRLAAFRTKKADVAGEVARLVPLLQSPKWKSREDATESLRNLGPEIVPKLKELVSLDQPPEVRARVKMLLDALGPAEAPGQQRLPGSNYTCESAQLRPIRGIRLVGAQHVYPPWRAVPLHAALSPPEGGTQEWLAIATNLAAGDPLQQGVPAPKPIERGIFVLSADSARLIANWPAADAGGRTSLLADGKGGLWIGIERRGLFHWDGEKTEEVSDKATSEYCEILGCDRLGRVLLSNGSSIAAYWPGQPDMRK